MSVNPFGNWPDYAGLGSLSRQSDLIAAYKYAMLSVYADVSTTDMISGCVYQQPQDKDKLKDSLFEVDIIKLNQNN